MRYIIIFLLALNVTLVRAQESSPVLQSKLVSPGRVLQPDTTVPHPLSLIQQKWMEQTADGANVKVEKGTAGFFNIPGNVKGSAIYAFHSIAARGSIIQVRNTNNGKVIYVEVLGPLPDTKQYAGCIIGLSDRAKTALGVRERKAFCELSYAGY